VVTSLLGGQDSTRSGVEPLVNASFPFFSNPFFSRPTYLPTGGNVPSAYRSDGDSDST